MIIHNIMLCTCNSYVGNGGLLTFTSITSLPWARCLPPPFLVNLNDTRRVLPSGDETTWVLIPSSLVNYYYCPVDFYLHRLFTWSSQYFFPHSYPFSRINSTHFCRIAHALTANSVCLLHFYSNVSKYCVLSCLKSGSSTAMDGCRPTHCLT